MRFSPGTIHSSTAQTPSATTFLTQYRSVSFHCFLVLDEEEGGGTAAEGGEEGGDAEAGGGTEGGAAEPEAAEPTAAQIAV